MKRNNWVTLAVLVVVIVVVVILLINPHPETPEEVAKCIGENSKLYVQLGCYACKVQEDMFGENYQYLDVTDCWFENEKCAGITATPTWIIKGEKYEEVLSIKKLQELTGCE